ncbi:MAG: porin [Xanthobacteraceae bacterium]
MKVTKSLLLGAAAGFVVMSGAQAADLPVKAKAVEYVKICSAYGAGFYYIPGTDICLRVGGFVRVDYNHNNNESFPYITAQDVGSQSHWMDRRQHTHEFHTRVNAIFDARQNTAYGTLRAYFNTGWNFSTAGSASNVTTATAAHANQGFIQWAGFTFGRAASFFDFYGSTGPHANLVNWGGQTTGAGGHNVLAYTAQFGNGVSGTISLEDPRHKGITPSGNLQTGLGMPTTVPLFNVRAGQNVPGVVGNLRVDQAWGSAQIMGAVQELRTIEGTSGMSISTYGYAVGGGFTWNNPSAPGSQFGIQASWAVGAGHYTTSSYVAHFMFDQASTTTGSIGTLLDGVIVGTSLEKTKAWGVNAGYQHRFSPNWAATLHGAYNAVDYNATVNAAVANCGGDCDFSFWSLGTRLLWTPVPGLDFGLDLLYHTFESMNGVTAGLMGSRDVWASQLRVIRNF